MEQWQQFYVVASQLVPFRGAVPLTMTSKGRQDPLQTGTLANIGQ